jgi:prepilin-type N-terminal cleavage/methylation domain-containing protein|tara:strand:- start:814 stop:1371 length:558 start_codon:yes stop_codon:yes gene_type:complete
VIRRGFNLLELVIATAITAVLLTAVMVALSASFRAYRQTTESASTGVIGRIVMERIQGLIRNGQDFAPYPGTLASTVVDSNELDILRPDGTWVTLAWVPATQSLHWRENGENWVLLEGVTQQPSGTGSAIAPFALEFHRGRHLHRARIDLCVVPDDVQGMDIEGTSVSVLRLVGSAMPRAVAWDR